MELNPDNPITEAARDQWHKLLALTMFKLDKQEVHITFEDLKAMEVFYQGFPVVILHDKADGLHLKLLSIIEALKFCEEFDGQI